MFIDFGTKIIEILDDIIKNHGPELLSLITSISVTVASRNL